jgi:uncharacterized protein with PIN domain
VIAADTSALVAVVLGEPEAERFLAALRSDSALSFGDCFAYATASLANVPLLFKGNDFAQTDLRTA